MSDGRRRRLRDEFRRLGVPLIAAGCIVLAALFAGDGSETSRAVESPADELSTWAREVSLPEFCTAARDVTDALGALAGDPGATARLQDAMTKLGAMGEGARVPSDVQRGLDVLVRLYLDLPSSADLADVRAADSVSDAEAADLKRLQDYLETNCLL